MTDDPAPGPALHPVIQQAFQSHFDHDLVDWNVPDFLAMQGSFVATEIVNGHGDLERMRADVERLRSGDQVALRALDRACGWRWDEEVATRAALQTILAEISKALEFRIGWNARDG